MNDINKNQTVISIENLGYTIQATSQNGGESRLYLVEDNIRIASINFYSNNESIQKVRQKLAGQAQFRDNTYLSNALNEVYVAALAHTTVNERISPDKINPLIDALPDFQKKEYANRVDLLGGMITKRLDAMFEVALNNTIERQRLTTTENESLYLIHAIKDDIRFTNEYVGTERDFKEYMTEYKATILKLETFAPEFRATHREIDKIVFAYKNNTGDKSKMLETLKTFDDKALVVLENRLKEKGIDPKKFESDMKAETNIKIKPKM